jgi:signal transduction histidine kinase
MLTGSWDTSTITRAVTNLIDNAIRHSPGGTTVHVNVTKGDGLIDIAVSDHGPGIGPDQLDQVFERSWRADSTGGGSGLGLAIARQVARAHGGDVTVSSPDPTGYSTTFVFSIARDGPG